MKDQLIKLIESIDTDNVLNKEQKLELESFGESIVTKLNEEREAGYKAGFDESKNIAESWVDEFETEVDSKVKELVESTDILIAKREELAVLESNGNVDTEMVDKLSEYLSIYISDVMPESVVIDYKKLQRLEKVTESMRGLLIISEDEVHDKVTELSESIESTTASIKDELTLKESQLQAEMESRIKVESTLNKLLTKTTLSEKLKDIPDLEAKKLKRHFAESTVDEINETFDDIYSNIRFGIKEDSTKRVDVDLDRIKSIMSEHNEFDDIEDVEEVVSESIIDQYALIAEKSFR